MTKKIESIMIFNRSSHFFLLGLIAPVFSLALLARGVNLLQLGLLMGVYSASTILTELPTGGLADTVGRKRIYLVSQGIRILFLTVLLFSRSFEGLCAALILMGVSKALSSGSLEAHFIDELYRAEPGVDIQPVMSRLNFAIPLGIGIGSLMGGYLPELARIISPGQAEERLYDLNIIVLLFFTGIHILLTHILVKEKRKAVQGHPLMEGIRLVPEMISTSVKLGISNPVLLLMMGSILFWGLSVSGLEQLWQPRVKDILPGLVQTRVLGFLSFGYFASSSLGSLLATPLCRLFKNRYPLVLFLIRICMGLSFLFLASRSSMTGFTLFYFLTFSFNGMANGPEETVLNNAIPSERRATLLSFSSLFMQLGGLTGSILHGYLAEKASISTSWTVAALLLMSSSLFYIFIPNHKSED